MHLDLAAVARARGDHESAARHLGEAHALFELLGVPRYVERVEREVRTRGVPRARAGA